MKKFLYKAAFLGTILTAFLVLLNLAYVNTSYYRNLNGVSKFEKIADSIDVVNFGNSHGQMAFNWESCKEFTGVNMALASQTIVYDEALFEQYFDYLHAGSTVILEISFRSLYEEEDKDIHSAKITRYYRVLEKEYFKWWNFSDALKYRYIPVLGDRQEAVRKILGEWMAGEKTVSSMEDTFYVDIETPEMEEIGKKRAEEFMALSGSQEYGEQYEALLRIIEKCKENNIQVILVTAPTLSCFYESFTEDFMDKFYADVREIASRYDIRYIDYTGDPRFPDDGCLFHDPDHLTLYGSEIFTKEFLKDNDDIFTIYSETK